MLHAFISGETPMSDEALAMRARDGSRSAFAALVARYQDRIYRLAMRMSRNPSDAEEITQDAFLQAHRGIGSFHGEARFGTWLYRIAVNQALMLRRSAKRRPTQSLEALCPDAGDVGITPHAAAEGADDLLHRKDLAQRAYGALSRLDEAHRVAVVLRDLEGLSADEAADVLGISPDAVRQRAHRARLKLREELRDVLTG
jgi:RNA polymerase sigma-70 factor (ECF subfamily)